MARKGDTRKASAVTAKRAARLCRLLRLLGSGPQTRDVLTRRTRSDVRSFYRDLEVLRTSGIAVTLEKGRYVLKHRLADATERLPFPDPMLNLGEARQLARGRGPAHRKLKKQIAQIIG